MSRYNRYLLLLLVIMLVACMPSTSRPTRERVSIAFMTFPMEPAGLWEELIGTFEEANPTIHVEPYYQQIPDDWPKHADVALGFGLIRGLDVVDRGEVLDLSPFIDSDPGFDTNDFHPGVLALHQHNGHTWAIPVGVEFSVLVYRQDLFREAGALSQQGETWTAVLEAACRLNDNSLADKEQYSFFDQGTVHHVALDWIAEQGGGLYRIEGGNIVPALDRPEIRQAVSAYLDISAKVTSLVDGPREMTTGEVLEHIARGEVGMAVMGLSAVVDYVDQHPEVALAPLPPGDIVAQRAVYSSSELAISAGTAHPQAAWRWVRFLSRQNLGRGDLPSRRSVTELSGTWGRMSPQVAQVVRSSLERQIGRSRPGSTPAVRFIYGAVSKALTKVQEEQTDIETALADAQREAMADISAWQEQRDATTPPSFSVSAPSSSTRTIIEFQASSNRQLYQAAAEDFEEYYPKWHIQVSPLGPTQPSGCLATYVDGSALTRVLTWDQLIELNPLAEADQQFWTEEFLPQAAAAVTWRGTLYGVPSSLKPLVLYYNPDVFQKAGLEVPTSDWTVEDVLAAAEQIEMAGLGDFGYLPRGHDVPFLLEQQGISLFTSAPLPRPRFTASEVSQALQRLRRLGEGMSFPIPFSELISLIERGRVGMWFDVFDYWSGVNWPSDTRVTSIQVQPGTQLPLQVNVFGLASEAQHPQICWEWINFLTQQGISAQDELPALRRLAESEATHQALGDELFVAYMEMLRRGENVPVRDIAVEDWATWWFVQALEKTRTENLEDALQTAQDKAEVFVTCLGASGDNLDRARLCAQQADPDHPLAQLAP